MSKKIIQKPLTAAIGAVIITSLSGMPIANADSNPFAATQLSSGYMVADSKMEGKCGEGKCGGKKQEKAAEEGKCGEGKCGSDKKVKKEGLDPVGNEDGDVDNDGDSDKSDKYLKNRRRVIANKMKSR